MSELKKALYNYFDKFGIDGEYRSIVKISFDVTENTVLEEDSRRFIPQIEPFNITQDKLNETILEYIRDTTSIEINSVDFLHRYPSIDGLPFLLRLNENDYDKIKFYLAFENIPGSLTIRGRYKIRSLGNIKKVDGDLAFLGSEIYDLGELQIVTGSFWIGQFSPLTNLEDLNNLEFVGKDLYLKGSPIKDLKNLKRVGGTLNLRGTKVESLGLLEYVGGSLYLPKELRGRFDLSKIDIKKNVRYYSS